MTEDTLVTLFFRFGLAGLLGFLIGIEREMRDQKSVTLGIRDFVLFALLGALSGYAAQEYQNSWLILAGFVGLIALILSSFWAERDHGPGITTELAAVIVFFLGVMIMDGATEISIALAIFTLTVLFPKKAIKRFRTRIQVHELQAVLLFLVITFIVLPILPRQPLDAYLSVPAGAVTEVDPARRVVTIESPGPTHLHRGDELELVDQALRPLAVVEVTEVGAQTVTARVQGEHFADIRPGMAARVPLHIPVVETMLSALNLYKIWLIVVLVSLISFVGYVLIKIVGSRAGIGLTGLIGGLVSSTVTTLSFARRSKESPNANPLFAGAVILAASIMFPRLILEIAVVNTELMKSIAVPLTVMGLTGFLFAVYLLWRPGGKPEAVEVSFDNPFSLKSALSFALLFATILAATRLATTYLGTQWLPAVAVLSGLTDADAIAFSISDLQGAGLVNTDWASFNLVLGALSNTLLKLFLVFLLGHHELFKRLLLAFTGVALSGIVTMILYYDLL